MNQPSPPKRYPDWPRRLNEYVVKVRSREFRYGRFDCCTFAAGAVKAMTDEDPMKEFRSRYGSKKQAAKALREIGSGTLYHTLCDKFGQPVRGAHGRRGDIGYHEGCCGVVVGRFAIFIGEFGLATVSISRLEWAFRVPE